MTDPIRLGQPANAATLPPVVDRPACMEIFERVAAIWNAFLACISDLGVRLFSWCASWIQSPAPQPQAAPAAEPVIEKEPATQKELVEWYRKTHILDYQGRMQDHRTGQPQVLINFHNQLYYAASPHYTNARHNYTARLLRLGGDATSVAIAHNGMTPLRCAVLTGSFLAYKTLRDAGADPQKFYGGFLDTPETTLELAHRMVASSLSVRDFFRKEVPKKSIPALYFTGGILQQYYGAMAEDQFGTKEDIAKMIGYEQQRIFKQIDPILGGVFPPPLMQLVAGYLTLETFK